jgi:GAF domain-containing protein
MPAAALHPLESERLESIRDLRLPNHYHDDLLSLIAKRAAEQCGTPIALVTLVEEETQWYIGTSGIEAGQTPRDIAFCAHTILEHDPTVVPDATKDPRFEDNPDVVDGLGIRFYAGAPMMDAGGLPLGSVCVVDTKPRDITSKNLFALQNLAALAGLAMEIRRVVTEPATPEGLNRATRQLELSVGRLLQGMSRSI